MDASFAYDVFVYGTLKVGFRNHGRYCYGAQEIQRATIPGRLYECVAYQYPFPCLVIPECLILARGSADLAVDIRLAKQFDEERLTELEFAHGRDWSLIMHEKGIDNFLSVHEPDGAMLTEVCGEWMRFEDPSVNRMRQLDQLESFYPDSLERSEYWRVLVPVRLSDGAFIAAWLYIDATEQTDMYYYPYPSWPDHD